MLSLLKLLDPRVLIGFIAAILLSSALGFGYGYHKRGHIDELENTAKIAAANQEARRNEQKRQENVDAATKIAAEKDNKLRNDVVTARKSADGMRDDLIALQRASEKSLAACQQALKGTSELFTRSTDKYLGMAENAQRADTEARELREAWPK